MKIALQIFSVIGVLLGLAIFSYLSLSVFSFLVSAFFIFWGILSFFCLAEKKKYQGALKIFSILGAITGGLLLILVIWGFIISASIIVRNYLLFALLLSLLLIPWSVLGLRFLRSQK